jgi:hypothetical protein
MLLSGVDSSSEMTMRPISSQVDSKELGNSGIKVPALGTGTAHSSPSTVRGTAASALVIKLCSSHSVMVRLWVSHSPFSRDLCQSLPEKKCMGAWLVSQLLLTELS